jgi:hypothetical protein
VGELVGLYTSQGFGCDCGEVEDVGSSNGFVLGVEGLIVVLESLEVTGDMGGKEEEVGD